MSRYSAETLDEAREALRRLSSDVAAFRSPAVQRHLSSPSDATSNPALQAQIISLRTQLHEAAEQNETSKEQLHSSRKRAANAEARVKELEANLHTQQLSTAELELRVADRIEKLETDKKQQRISAAETATVLRDTVERDRLGYASVVAQRDEFEALVKRLKDNIAALEREKDSVSENLRFEKKTAHREKDRLRKKTADLEAEVEYLRAEIEGSNQKVASSRLDSEVKRLRQVVIEMKREDTISKRELDKMRGKVEKLEAEVDTARGEKERRVALEAEVGQLRTEKNELWNMAQQAKALVKEREQVMALVKRLSESGSVQEGLAILTEAAAGKPLSARTERGRNDAAGRSDFELERHRRELEDVRGQGEEVAAKLRMEVMRLEEDVRKTKTVLQKTEAERDAAQASSKSSERVRRILEVQKIYFKGALDRIETELDKPADPDGSVKRLRKRCDVYEKTVSEYQNTVTQLERSLQEAHVALSKLKAELADVNARRSSGSSGHSNEELSKKLLEATKSAKEALCAQKAAEETARKISGRLKEVEEELEKLRQSDGASVANNESDELDYNPSEVKVLHLTDNLFAKAVHAAQIAEDTAKGKKRMRMAIESGASPLRDSAIYARMKELEKELEELTEKYANLEQRSKVGIRTGEIAKKRIGEVRAAVYNLFGWSMNIKGAKYTIASIYAESPDEYLEFGVNASGTMALMETEYTRELADVIEQYVQQMHSIPALLSHITMQNFEKTTVIC